MIVAAIMAFIIGFLVGGVSGVVVFALATAAGRNRDDDE